MTLGKRKKFWACFLEVECVFTVCASGYALNTSISYYFVFGPGGPSSFSLTNKQTNEQANNAWSQVSFILTPVSSAVTTLNKRSKWRFHVVNPMQAKARIIQYFHPVPYFADCEKALSGQLKTFQESSLLLSTPTQAWRRPVLTLKACQRVWWDPAQNCWDISEYFSTSRRAINSSILKTVQSRAPLPIPFQSCSPLTAYLCIS